MLITTTDTLQGFRIETYLGIVTGQAVIGEGVSKKFRTGIRDVGCGYPHDYGKELNAARQAALEEATRQAAERGANGLVGVAIAFAMAGDASRMVLVSVSGTAVTIAVEQASRETLRRLDFEPAQAGMR